MGFCGNTTTSHKEETLLILKGTLVLKFSYVATTDEDKSMFRDKATNITQ